ncbi:ArsR family transcriptional regulator [Nanoarchaeota archaeon]
MALHRHISLIYIKKPVSPNINHKLQWLGSSLGLFNLRDRDKSCFRIFIELIKTSKHNEPISSDELSSRAHLTRGTVVHHLHKLMDSGIVIKERRGYILRQDELTSIVNLIEKDCIKMCESLKDVAKEIDESLS